nr:hypothetical protein [Tanacetum cinerariifolium]
EDIGEVGATGTAETTAATHARVDAGMAVLVIGRPLAGVGKNLVGLVGLLEFLFRGLVVRVAVRVIFHCEAAISLLQ